MASYFTKDALYCARFAHLSDSLITFTFDGNNNNLINFLKKEIPKHFGDIPIMYYVGADEEAGTYDIQEWNETTQKWTDNVIAFGEKEYEKALVIRKVSLPKKGENYTAVLWNRDETQLQFSYGKDHAKTIAWLKTQFPTYTDSDLIALRMGSVAYEHGSTFYHFLIWENGKWTNTVRCDDDSIFDNAIMLFYKP